MAGSNTIACGYHCYNLTSVTIPDSVKEFGENAFFMCKSLKSIEIPSGVTIIRDNTFWFCDSLASVKIPSSITRIGSFAFSDCGSLSDFIFDGTTEQWNSVTKISNFLRNTKLNAIRCTDGDVPVLRED